MIHKKLQMILIMSDHLDRSTIDVMDWLIYWKVPFIRINETTVFKHIDLYLNTNQVDVRATIEDNAGQQTFRLSEISGYWYRRGKLHYPQPKIRHSDPTIQKNYNRYINTEKEKLVQFIHLVLDQKPGIGSYLDNSINKLEVLLKATSCGLDIPDTLITDQQKTLDHYLHEKGQIIQKAIGPMGYVPLSDKESLAFYTRTIEQDEITGSPAEFLPSLFQEQLQKKYELRIFYLFGQCHTTAIFSQQDEQTQVDFRHYNAEKPNRTPKFELPQPIIEKLTCLMNALKLESGSIDMVVTQDNRYVFLEVNPVGQYTQVAYPINVDLSKIIAQNLSALYEQNAQN